MITVRSLNKALNSMRNIYDFDGEKTAIELIHSNTSDGLKYVEIRTFDEKNKVWIKLQADAEEKEGGEVT